MSLTDVSPAPQVALSNAKPPLFPPIDRIDLRRDQCLDLIEKHDIGGLVARDQLRRQLRENPAHRLRRFYEAPIDFLPTYKYDRWTDLYDTSDKGRVPAYCDRILWHARNDKTDVAAAATAAATGAAQMTLIDVDAKYASAPPSPILPHTDSSEQPRDACQRDRVSSIPDSSIPTVQCLAYWRGEQPGPSDHRPVMAHFAVQVRRTDAARRSALVAHLQKVWHTHEAVLLHSAERYYYPHHFRNDTVPASAAAK